MKPVLAIIATTAALGAAACNRAADAAPEPAAAAAAPAIDFPVLAAGKWRTITSVDGMRIEKRKCQRAPESIETAFGYTPGFAMNCETTFRKVPGGIEAKTLCKNNVTQAAARYLVTGDFQTSYAIDETVDYTPEYQGLTHVSRVRSAERIGECEAK